MTQFVDTGAWIALSNRSDALHEPAVVHYRSLRGARLITTNYVVDETATRLRNDLGLSTALQFRRTIAEEIADRGLRLVWIDARLEHLAWTILEENPTVPLSLTDATSAACARNLKVDTIFGFDRGFEALRFTLVPVVVRRR
ncbi:MAG: type II toxin-antitoxin system VapC family toxin [Candidatus Dormibacteria bacterium]